MGLLLAHEAQAQAGQWPVFQYLGALAGFCWAPLKVGQPSPAGLRAEVVSEAAEFGRLAQLVEDVLDPASPAGDWLSPEEVQALRLEVAVMQSKLMALLRLAEGRVK